MEQNNKIDETTVHSIPARAKLLLKKIILQFLVFSCL